MNTNRREFLANTLWLGATVAAAGCVNARNKLTGASGAPMQGYADKPLKRVRVGIAGVGYRGIDAVDYISQLPNTEVAALCDLYRERIDLGNRLLVEKSGKPKAKRTFVGPEAYKAMCEWDGVDVIYVTAPWLLHVTIARCALAAGKIALVEVPSALTIDETYAKAKYGAGTELGDLKVKMGDVNTTLIRTALGRSIQVRHNVATPQRGYRYEMITGSNGIWGGFPDKLYFKGHGAPETEDEAFFDEKTYNAMREKYKHPCWKAGGAAADVVGGHGGMDFMMGLRWTYCLQAGIPLDFDVYDLASWCSICELSERSCTNGSRPVEFPDYTRGAWKTTPPAPLATFKPGVIDLNPDSYRKNKEAMRI